MGHGKVSPDTMKVFKEMLKVPMPYGKCPTCHGNRLHEHGKCPSGAKIIQVQNKRSP
jgi:hypothetical protein